MGATKLNYVMAGPATQDAPVVVFLHGFAGDLGGWANLQVGLSPSVRSIAFDLPGHGGSLDYQETCNAIVAAKAVMADLDALGLEWVHLVGHSMGGAVSALIAMRQPERVASLCLLAPGGFGPEINQALLRRYGRAREVDVIHMLLEQFFGLAYDVPIALAEQAASHRALPGALEALQATAEAILDGKQQKTLPLAEIAALTMPIKVIWGRQDRVLPYRQSEALPGNVALHSFGAVGHMPHIEVSREVLALIRQNVKASG